MKKIFTLMILLTCTLMAKAQVAQGVCYQMIVKDKTGNIVSNTDVGIKFSILYGSPSGEIVFSDDTGEATNDQGLVTLFVKEKDLLSIDWGKGSYFLRMDIDLEGGTDYSLTSVTEILAKPFAMKAAIADSFVGTLDETDEVFKTSLAYDFTTGDTLYLNNLPDTLFEMQSLADVVAINNSVNSQIKNVSSPKDPSDVATKSYVDSLYDFFEDQGYLVTDRAPYLEVYPVVKIGSQTWLAKNNAGQRSWRLVIFTSDNTDWSNAKWPACYWYDGDVDNVEKYGMLYNGYAASSDACPTGWHVPSSEDFDLLVEYLQMVTDSITDMSVAKAMASTFGWDPHDTTGTPGNFQKSNNISGFNALPGGYRDHMGDFYFGGSVAGFWTSDAIDNTRRAYYIKRGSREVSAAYRDRRWGHSIRCIQD